MRVLDPFLMFCGDQHGKAEEAVHWYCSIFDDSRVVSIDRFGPDDGDAAGSVRHATFEVGGNTMRAIDSAAPHGFTFTPAISLWFECTSAEELERVAAALVDGGEFLMPPDDYGFSRRFCWVADRYGVTWQLNVAR